MHTDSSRNRRSLKVRIDQTSQKTLFMSLEVFKALSQSQGATDTSPGRLCVIRCERTVISTLFPSLDERQVRHSHVIVPLVKGKGKGSGGFISICPVHPCSYHFSLFLSDCLQSIAGHYFQ